MGKRIKIILNGNPVNTASFYVSVQVVDLAQTNYFSATFKNTPVFSNDILIGANVNATSNNLETYLNSLIVPAYITFGNSGNEIYIDVDPENTSEGNIIIGWGSSSGISIEIIDTNPLLTLTTALVRSTYSLRTIPNVTFDRAEIQLFVWNGDINNPPNTPSYNLSKPVVQLGQNVINFDINTLLKEFIETSIGNYTLNGLQPTNYTASCWATYVVICYDGEDNVFETTSNIFSLYGYGEFTNGFNPQLQSNVLITGDSHRYFQGQDSRLYFITNELISLVINGVTISVTANENLNYEYLQSINLKDYAPVNDKIIIVFTYDNETRTMTFDLDCEIKYSVINCVFINRYGVNQSLFLSKVSKHGDDVDGDEYRGLISNFGIYDTTKHQYKEFNKNGRGKTICNTANLNEYENTNLKELLYSEQVWLIENGIILPVKLNKNSFDYKTNLNDKQIQYAIEFKHAFDTINQVY